MGTMQALFPESAKTRRPPGPQGPALLVRTGVRTCSRLACAHLTWPPRRVCVSPVQGRSPHSERAQELSPKPICPEPSFVSGTGARASVSFGGTPSSPGPLSRADAGGSLGAHAGRLSSVPLRAERTAASCLRPPGGHCEPLECRDSGAVAVAPAQSCARHLGLPYRSWDEGKRDEPGSPGVKRGDSAPGVGCWPVSPGLEAAGWGDACCAGVSPSPGRVWPHTHGCHL